MCKLFDSGPPTKAETSKAQSQKSAKEIVSAGQKTVKTSSGASVPVPPPRPDFAYQSKSILGKIKQDIAMGIDDLAGQRSDKYTPAEWQAYDIRTAKSLAQQSPAEQIMREKDDKPAPAPEKPAEPVAETPTEPAAPPPPTPVETAQAEVELRVDDLVKDPGQRAAEERARGTPEMDVGTAAGAQAERAAVIADTQAEQEAADALLKGRRSTILTTPGGLLAPAEEEGKTTRRKSLLGA